MSLRDSIPWRTSTFVFYQVMIEKSASNCLGSFKSRLSDMSALQTLDDEKVFKSGKWGNRKTDYAYSGWRAFHKSSANRRIAAHTLDNFFSTLI